MATDPTGAFEIVHQVGQPFTDAQVDDFVIRTTTSNQRILLGTVRDQASLVTLTSNTVDVQGNLRYSGSLFAGSKLMESSHWSSNNTTSNIFKQDGRVSVGSNIHPEQFNVFGNALLSSNAYVLRNLSIGKSNPAYNLDVQGTANISSNLLLGGNLTTAQPIYANGFFVQKDSNAIATTSLSAAVQNIGIADNGMTLAIQDKTSAYAFHFVASNVSNTVAQILGDGRMAIGTSNPPCTLYLQGTNEMLRMTNVVQTLSMGVSSNFGSYLGTIGPHSLVLAPSNTERLRVTSAGNVGIGNSNPLVTLDVNGIANIWAGTRSAVIAGYMAPGSLTLGSTSSNFGGGNNWNTNTAGLLLECLDNTEIAVHDSLNRVASLAYYQGGSTNRFTLGRDMGFGTTSIEIASSLLLSSNAAELYLGAQNTSSNVGSVGGRILFGGTLGDLSYQLAVIETRLFGAAESSELLLFKGNDPTTQAAGPDRIRLRAPSIILDTYNAATADRITSNIRVLVDPNGNVGVGTTAPSALLDVNGTSRFQDTMTFSNTTSWAAAPANGVTGGTGTRIVLWPGAAGAVPYGFGINANTLWYTVPTSACNVWYDGTTPQMQLVNGQLICTGDVAAFGTISDSNLKTNIQDLDPALTLVNTLRPVTFAWKEDIFQVDKRGKPDVGFLAQEVEQVLPLVVGQYDHIGTSNVYKNLKHERMLPYLVRAIQELTHALQEKEVQVQNLQERLSTQETLLQKLVDRVAALEERT